MLRLAQSEEQQISAAYEKAERSLAEAAESMTELVSLLERTASCVSKEKIDHLRKAQNTCGDRMFRLNCRLYQVKELMKLDRVFK